MVLFLLNTLWIKGAKMELEIESYIWWWHCYHLAYVPPPLLLDVTMVKSIGNRQTLCLVSCSLCYLFLSLSLPLSSVCLVPGPRCNLAEQRPRPCPSIPADSERFSNYFALAPAYTHTSTSTRSSPSSSPCTSTDGGTKYDGAYKCHHRQILTARE